VLENMGRLRLGRLVEQLDALLSDAARGEPTYLDFLDSILREEVGAKQRKRVAMGITIAHFPAVKTLEDFDFKFQPSVDQKLVRELAVSRYVANAENVLVFGPPGVGKTHLAIGLGRAAVEAGYTVLFTSATALLGALSKAETEGQLAERLAFYAKPKLLVVDELGYLPFEKRSAHLFFQLVARRYERGAMIITTNQVVTGHSLRRRGPRRRDSRPPAAPQLHADDPGRELQAEAEAQGRPARQVREGELNPEVEGVRISVVRGSEVPVV
jgi:DNA replication protein DnaC